MCIEDSKDFFGVMSDECKSLDNCASSKVPCGKAGAGDAATYDGATNYNYTLR